LIQPSKPLRSKQVGQTHQTQKSLPFTTVPK
jgi:hypothetical protein